MTYVVASIIALLQAASGPSFDVATIKVNLQIAGLRGGGCSGTDSTPGSGPIAAVLSARGLAAPPPGVCQFTALTLKNLIADAYALGLEDPDGVLTGGPSWTNSTRFDVRAKAEQPRPRAELRLMMQRLLADRFGLLMHTETRLGDGFALVVSDVGSKLAKATGKETPKGIGRTIGKPATASDVSMKELAQMLSRALGRPVADETGFAGGYNFTLTWTPGDGERVGLAAFPLSPEIQEKMRAGFDPNGPSIYTALQEQLGLRLQRKQVPREVMVIDRATPPTEK